MFFHQPHVATRLKLNRISRGRSGQSDEDYEEDGTIDCLFKSKGGEKVADPKIEFTKMRCWLWTETQVLFLNDRITNVINKIDGIVIEPGIFTVVDVDNVTDLYGKTHHVRYRLEGVGHERP